MKHFSLTLVGFILVGFLFSCGSETTTDTVNEEEDSLYAIKAMQNEMNDSTAETESRESFNASITCDFADKKVEEKCSDQNRG